MVSSSVGVVHHLQQCHFSLTQTSPRQSNHFVVWLLRFGALLQPFASQGWARHLGVPLFSVMGNQRTHSSNVAQVLQVLHGRDHEGVEYTLTCRSWHQKTTWLRAHGYERIQLPERHSFGAHDQQTTLDVVQRPEIYREARDKDMSGVVKDKH